MNLTVNIPKNEYYTLFAEGKFLSKHSDDNCTEITFAKKGILILFYHFPKHGRSQHRRVYITCNPDTFENKYVHSLEGVSEERTVLAELRGRAFDRLKMSLEYIRKETNDECYTYSNEFWLKVSYLMHAGKNSQYNINNLISIFKEIK